MSLGAGIFDFLSAGLSVGERVYPLSLPQGVLLPAMTYQVISDVLTVTHSDAQDHPTYSGFRHTFTRVQFDCYAESYDEAEALADELQALAVGYRGAWGDVDVQSVLPDVRLDDRDPETDTYRVICDLIVGHQSPGAS